MKQSAYILLAALVMSCQPSGGENVEKARAMFDAFNRHDWSAMASFYSEPASFLDPSFGTGYVNKIREETAAKYAEMEKMFPDIHDELVGVYPSGDKVTVEFISTGTAPDSTKFKLPIITVLTFKDGLIVKDATYYDNP
jgi:ketosteroid isomerase-like protein